MPPVVAALEATLLRELLVAATELGVLLRDELVSAIALLVVGVLERTEEELLVVTATEELLRLLGTTELEAPSEPPLGLVPTKYRSGAGGVAMPSPRKKLVCGGWL